MNQSKTVFVVAHRGAPAVAQENTRSAFEAAIRFGADFIETDIRRTGDGILVLHHDADSQGQPIARWDFPDLREQLRAHNSDLTTFDELLSLARNRIKLDLELKEAGYEKQILEHLQMAGLLKDDFVITSFLDEARSAVKALQPELRCGLLVEDDRDSLSPGYPQRLLQRLQQTHSDFIAAKSTLVSPRFADHLFTQGYPVWVWTVDDPEAMKVLLQTPGVQALITNRADLALEIRSRLPPERP
jgi:glycerophosphoryl diester phosphodiesterase